MGYSLAEMAYQKILAKVIAGTFAERTRLPSETKLALELGMSRPVLRIALARLKADGILASRQGSGNFVVRQPHATVLSFAPLNSITDVQDCFKFRIGVEGDAAYYAAVNLDDASRQSIEAAYKNLKSAADHEDSGVNADSEFHIQIAKASGNPYFLSSLQAIRNQIEYGVGLTRQLSLRRSKGRYRQVEEEHRLIRKCVFERDADRSRTAMRAHLEAARRRLFEGDINQ